MMGNNGALKEKLTNVASDLFVDELDGEFGLKLAHELEVAMDNVELSSISKDDVEEYKRAIGHALADVLQEYVNEALELVFDNI